MYQSLRQLNESLINPTQRVVVRKKADKTLCISSPTPRPPSQRLLDALKTCSRLNSNVCVL